MNDDGPQLLGEAVSGERVPSRGTMLGAGMSAAMGLNDIDESQQLKQSLSEKELAEKEKLQREKYEKLMKISRMQKERLTKWEESEIKNLRKNRVKILNKWRNYMREIKYDELSQQIDIISSTNYRELDHQIYKLKNVNNDMDKLNDQFLVCERSHFRKMEQLNDIHKERMIELQSEFERDLEILKNEFNSEKEYILSYNLNQQRIGQCLINEIEKRELNEQHEIKQIHETEREELRNKNLEDLNVLKISLEAEIEEYEKQFDETHDRYIESTEDKNREFAELKQKDEKLSTEIENLMKRIELLQQQLIFWKKKIANNDKDSNQKIKILKKNKSQLMQQYKSLKSKMSKFRKLQNERLSNIVSSARETNEKNTNILLIGQRILKYAQMADKLQTEKEKVLPFGNDIINNQINENIDIDIDNDDDDHSLLSNMKYFIQKYNFALIDSTTFEEKRKTLSAENKKLRAILKAYLRGITVSKNTINEANTLFVVNNNTQYSQNENNNNKLQQKQEKLLANSKTKTIVEGNQIINAYQTQLNTNHINVSPLF